jgi:hypothetical protein
MGSVASPWNACMPDFCRPRYRASALASALVAASVWASASAGAAIGPPPNAALVAAPFVPPEAAPPASSGIESGQQGPKGQGKKGQGKKGQGKKGQGKGGQGQKGHGKQGQGPSAPKGAPKGGAQGKGGAPQGGGGAAAQPKAAKPVQSDFNIDPGRLGTIYPQPASILVDDEIVHLESHGGCEQTLRELAADPGGGFGAVWQDVRNGNLGLYFGRLDARGAVQPGEAPVNPPFTSRQFEPALAFAASSGGAVAWFSTNIARQGVTVRFFDDNGAFPGAPVPLGTQRDSSSAAAREGRAGRGADGGATGGNDAGAGVIVPDIAYGAAGGAVAWAEGTQVYLQRFKGARESEGKALEINPSGPAASGPPQIAIDGAGRTLVAFDTGAGVALALIGAGDQTLVKCGAGKLEQLVLDPAAPNAAWILVRDGDGFVARHFVDRAVASELRLDAAVGAASARLAAWVPGNALALLTEGAPAAASAFEIRLLAADGKPLLPDPIRLPDERALRPRGAQIACQGSALVVAWTDDRNGEPDVYYRFLDPQAPMSEDRRFNADELSSSQTNVVIAGGADSALIAWQDERDGAPRIWARRIVQTGEGTHLAAEELPVGGRAVVPGQAAPPNADAPAARSPAAAQNRDGRFFVAWAEEGGHGLTLRGEVFGATGAPAAAPFDLDPGQVASAAAPGVVALLENRGYLVLWAREDGTLVSARVSLSGKLESGPQVVLTPRARARNPALARLDSGRIIGAWDVKAGKEGAYLQGVFLTEDGRPDGDAIDFEATPSGTGDLDPSLAPAAGGGFLMSWTGNDSPARDVVARLFDGSGRPAGPPLALSVKSNEQDTSCAIRLADGSFVVAWEDDIVGVDQVVLRRVGADGRTLGPRCLLHQTGSVYVEDRTAGWIAPLGDGLVGAWDDRRRSRGHDIYVRALGARFDVGLAEAIEPEKPEQPAKPAKQGAPGAGASKR